MDSPVGHERIHNAEMSCLRNTSLLSQNCFVPDKFNTVRCIRTSVFDNLQIGVIQYICFGPNEKAI